VPNLYLSAPIATADFNGDGIPDLLLTGTNYGGTDSELVLYLGKGDGTFQAPILTDIGTVIGSVYVGVLTGDGKPDVLVLDSAGTALFVFLGKGDGTFTPLAPDLSMQTNSLVLGDFNGDGHLDIAFPQPNDFAVALGNGDGTFQAPILTTGIQPIALAAADFNGDGKLDLAAGTTSSVVIFLGNGNGTFQPPVETLPIGGSVLATADFTGNGKFDIVASDGFYAGVFLGQGDGTFTEKSSYAISGGDITVGDFNNDHKLDFVTTQDVVLGNGDGTFQAQVVVPTNDASPDPNTTEDEGGAVTADFNNDGKPDLAVVGGKVSILLNQGPGLTSVAYSYALPSDYTALRTSLAAADLRGNGNVDLLIGVTSSSSGASSLLVMLGNGDGSFGSPTAVPLGTGNSPVIAVGDFNGDKKPDVAVIFGGGGSNMLILLGNGDGTFGSPSSYYAGLGETWLALGDFNGDGKLDAAVTGTAGVAILLGKGDGTFGSPTFSGSNSFTYVTTSDLNGDGSTDLITEFNSGGGAGGDTVSAQVLLGNGEGTFQSLTAFEIEHNVFFGFGSTMATADLTGDGKLDLIVGDTSRYLEVFPGNGDGTFGSMINFPLTQTYVNPVVADFNLDGKPDVAVGTNSGWVPLFYNTTQPDFTISATALSPATVAAGNSATSTVTIAALNGFNGTVQLSCSGLPSGANCSFIPSSVPNGAGTSALTVTTSASTPIGTYPVTVNGASGSLKHSALLSLVVQQAPDYTISATALSPATVAVGSSATSTITVTALNGFNGTVQLSCSGLPSGANCSFIPSSVPNGAGTSALTITTSGTTPIGTDPVTANGNSGSLKHSASLSLVVQQAPGFTVAASALSRISLAGRVSYLHHHRHSHGRIQPSRDAFLQQHHSQWFCRHHSAAHVLVQSRFPAQRCRNLDAYRQHHRKQCLPVSACDAPFRFVLRPLASCRRRSIDRSRAPPWISQKEASGDIAGLPGTVRPAFSGSLRRQRWQ